MVDTLLDDFKQYFNSPEYLAEKARSRKLDKNNADAVAEKNQQLQLKLRVHYLRNQVRQATKLERNQNAITDKKQKKLLDDYLSGKLTEELDQLTRQHGYGKVHSTGEMLQVSGFPARR